LVIPSEILAREFFCTETCNVEIEKWQNGKTVGWSEGSASLLLLVCVNSRHAMQS